MASDLEVPGLPITKIGIWFNTDTNIMNTFSQSASLSAIPSGNFI
jgi:hypothetical protein